MKYHFTFIVFLLLYTGTIHAQQKPVEKNSTTILNDLTPAQRKAMKDTIAAYQEDEKLRKKELARKLSSMLTVQQRMRLRHFIQSRRGMRPR